MNSHQNKCEDQITIDYDLFELNRNPKKVLIVEDDFINILVYKKLLDPLNFTLETAENGQIGLDMFKKINTI